MLLLTRADVEAVLDADELIDTLADAFRDLSAGRASMPQRVAAMSPAGLLGVMPAYLPAADALTVKLVTLFEANAGTELPTHQAAIGVFSPDRGNLLALMDGTWITAARTAAGSALATRLLARDDARVLTIVGTGVQAHSHAWAVPRVREFDEVRVVGRESAKTAAFASELGARAFDSYADAIDGADVVCATTHSPEPVVRRDWLAAGTHVNSVGMHPDGREIAEDVVRDAFVVVESRASAVAGFPTGSNELADADPESLVELGDVVAEAARPEPGALTLYKSVGVAVMDAAAAALVLRKAQEQGIGREVEL
jgi:ornithine cyclodeaminase/alanine dehydrogenase-like protein (mu-crystallin family)